MSWAALNTEARDVLLHVLRELGPLHGEALYLAAQERGVSRARTWWNRRALERDGVLHSRRGGRRRAARYWRLA